MDCYLVKMEIYGLCSGSKGNCFVIKNNEDFIIIDCGSTKKYLVQCFETLTLDYKRASALLLTHSHKDHCSQLKMFDNVAKYTMIDNAFINCNKLNAYEKILINDFEILPIPLSHDCLNTIGFVIKVGEERLVYITDTGYISSDDYIYLRGADYYVFESNHDIEMLMNTSRPHFTKSRIYGDSGHLCNEDCASALCKLVTENTKEIILAHISDQANTYELAFDVNKKGLDCVISDYKLQCARQFIITYGGKR